MTRLLVYYSIKDKITIKGIDFSKISNWTSEALISSPFVGAKDRREGYTHADMALGDFNVDYFKRGEIQVLDDARIFGIIEAKMGSNLTQGTTHAKDYDQASRNLACIAHNTFNNDCEIFFAVVAPETKLGSHDIYSQIDIDRIIGVIKERYAGYDASFKKETHMHSVILKAKSCIIWAISYEEWIEEFTDKTTNEFLNEFYKKAKHWNKI